MQAIFCDGVSKMAITEVCINHVKQIIVTYSALEKKQMYNEFISQIIYFLLTLSLH